MRVLVLNNAAPFIRGGAEELADQLVHRLNATAGVEAELLRIPFRWEPAERLVEQIVCNRNLRLYQVDRVIGLKFPAYLIPHQCKVLWLLHQFRQAYDLYESGMSHLCGSDSGARLVKVVRNADRQTFVECKCIYTNSAVTQARLQKFNEIASEVLHPPLLDAERFTGGDYGDYFFAGGRVGAGKRQHLLVEAMRYVRSNVRLLIAGPVDDEQYGSRLRDLVAGHDLAGRVELHLGFHRRDEIAKLVNGALACVYVPIDEDSLGYVCMEAFAAAKAVVTTSDSGGLLQLVHNGETGWVAAAEPRCIAEKLDEAAGRRMIAARMGGAARSTLSAMGLSWNHTITQLLSA
jgi:glycosyltransferase involved in cell wall biosynthesis